MRPKWKNPMMENSCAMWRASRAYDRDATCRKEVMVDSSWENWKTKAPIASKVWDFLSSSVRLRSVTPALPGAAYPLITLIRLVCSTRGCGLPRRHVPYRNLMPLGANSGIFGAAALVPNAASSRSRALTSSMNCASVPPWSGWHRNALRRNAAMMSSRVKSAGTPAVLHDKSCCLANSRLNVAWGRQEAFMLARRTSAFLVALAVLSGTATAKEWTKLRLGTSADEPPATSVQPDGTLVGLEIDLAADICKRMAVECEWVRQDFTSLIPALQQDKIDVIFVALAMTPKRQETIAFSTPFIGNRQGVLVLKTSPLAASVGEGNIEVAALDDAAQPAIATLAKALQGKVIGTDAGSSRVEMAERYFKGTELRTYPSPGDVKRELLAGHIDAALASRGVLVTDDSSQLQRIGPWFSGGVFGPGSGVALRKTDPELKAKLDEAIKAALADGTIKNLYLRYYHNWPPPM
jgi:octopine/nopaline transport system substrate-binding protein